MIPLKILSPLVAAVGLGIFSAVFTIIYRKYARSAEKSALSGSRDAELLSISAKQSSPKFKRRQKIFSAFKNVAFILVLVASVLLFTLSLANRISGGRPVLGKSFMVVASGSMSFKNEANAYLFQNDLNNQFNMYDVIVLERAGELKPYDVIAYRNGGGVNVIHRIVSVSADGSAFCTRGDANSADDQFHPTRADVIGIYRSAKIPYLGMAVLFLQSAAGVLTMLATLYCLIMADSAYGRVVRAERRRTQILLAARAGRIN